MSAELIELERVLADALCCGDPLAALRKLQTDESLRPATREALGHADGDGFGIAALLIVRLRFERLLQGSILAGAWFERDPATFAAAFKRYHTSVPPLKLMPAEEARAFESWQSAQEDAKN